MSLIHSERQMIQTRTCPRPPRALVGFVRTLGAAVCMAVLFAAAGCGSEESSADSVRTKGRSPTSSSRTQSFETFADVYAASNSDFSIFQSVDELVGSSSVVVEGVFDSLTDGPSMSETTDGRTATVRYVIARIRVTEVLAGFPAKGEDEFVYMEVMIPPTATLEEVARVFPTGQPVVAALAEWEPSKQPEGVKVENADGGRPAGVRLTSALSQGLFFQDVDGEFKKPLNGDYPGPLKVTNLEEATALFES